MKEFTELTVNGLANGAVLAITALGFVLIYKATEVINFAQGQFLVVGAFMVYTAENDWGLPWPAAVAVGIATGIVLGVAVERLILRRMIGEATLSVIMVTIGLASALAGVALGVWGAQGKQGPSFIPAGRVKLFGSGEDAVFVAANRLWAVGIATVVLIAVGLFFQKSRHGIAMRAVADDQQAAMVQGISVNRIFAMAWALAGAAGAVGGVLLASIAGSYGIELQAFAVFVFPVVILGGLDSVPGTVVGGVIVGLLVEYSKFYLSVSASVIIPFAALVLILLIKPYGLFGQVRIERV
ncbi:MAG TPA: branched-chain amino acid ABC transporter permease [Acidimicrobiia bacterium]|jgi:branched-chain amino acid transport system permease protein|nr:branched-chain amino acid ABC transporter permease [Acidimicrobiia bacterium]